MPKLDWTLYLAWLVAPTEQQRWNITRKIFGVISPVDWAIYCFWRDRITFGQLESVLRNFWLKVDLKRRTLLRHLSFIK